MAQHNSSQTLHQQQSQQQQQQQQSPQQQQQPQQNGVTQLPQVAVASQQNNNLTANYPHHYQMPGGSVFVPTQSPHGGTLYSVMPAPLPGNVFVNNVTANVNLHGAWATHPTYIPAGQTYIPATGEIPQNVASIEPIMQPIVNQQNNNTISRNVNRRNRNNSNPRNNSVNRRNDYNQRPHLNSPIPQDIANANSLDANNQTLNQGYHHPYGYPQFACQPPQFFNHVSPQQVSHSQAQQATGAPLYLTSMYPGPFFNYPVLISPATPAHMLPQAPPSQEYQLGDERNSENVVDQHGQPIHINVPGGTMMQPQLWNPHEIPIEYQEEYHVIGNEGSEDINHNTAVSITDSDTPSMMSPSGYSIHYDPNLQLLEAQQHMSSLQIYDQHGAPNEEDIHQQQILQDQQPDQHYPQMHDQVVMISHEVNVYDPESICERPEVHQEMNPVLQHIDSQITYNQYQQQTHIIEQEECYSDLQYENNSPEKLEYKNVVENIDFNQNVPNIQEENEIIQENANCAQELNLSTNSNESDASFEQNCEQIPLNVGNNIVIISEENSSQFVPTTEYHSSSESTKSGENIIQHNIPTHIPVIHPQPQLQIANPAVLLPYQPLLPNQIIPQQSVEIQNNQIPSAQIKSTVYNPTQITKKTTASVAVTATPIQHNIITHVGLSNNAIVPTVKTEISNAILLPKTNAILQIPTNNVSQVSGALPQRERKQPVVQVEQKSIASTAVPHQIQENNYQSNICNTNEVKKQEPNLTDHNAKKIEKKDELTNTLNTNKEIELKAPISTAHQPPTGPKSWASLFTPKPSNNTVPTNNNNSSLVNNTNHSNNVNKKPVAKVLPFEGTVNLQSNLNPGALSYSAASAQGISTNKITPSLTIPNMSSNVAVVHSNGSVKNGKPPLIQQIASSGDNSDEWTIKYADFLKKYKTDFSPISLKPRGLKNPNNYCFINAVLQALIGCSPLYNLLKSAPKQSVALHLDKSKIPTINAMTQLISDFNTLPFGVRLMNRRDRTQKQNQKQSINNDELVGELQTDSAFEASPIYKLWNSSRPDVDEGRQGDAEEFLSYVLNKLNDEMLEVIKLMSKPPTQVPVQQNGSTFGEGDEGGGDDWQMIYNNRNKGSVTRQTDFGKTPISDIFRGELRSRLQREGEHSTDVIQPFFTLQLNIEKAGSVREALEILVGRDQLEGVTCSKTNQEVVAWQQMNLEKLPLILIVHLKFFDYKSDGCTKIVKQFDFPLELKIDTKILASKKYSAKQKLYRLFAVVYHDGKEAVKGHYISDVYHSGYSNWLRYDDANVKPVSESSVLRPRGLRVPYLLFYRRCDTIATTSTSTISTPQQQQQQQHGLTHSK